MVTVILMMGGPEYALTFSALCRKRLGLGNIKGYNQTVHIVLIHSSRFKITLIRLKHVYGDVKCFIYLR